MAVELEGGDGRGETFTGVMQAMIGNGEQLSAHIAQRVEGTVGEQPLLDTFCITMGNLLAPRIGEGVTPEGFAQAITDLVTDCTTTRIDSLSQAPLPLTATTFPEARYRYFVSEEAPELARGAFGEEFARQVVTIQTRPTELDQTDQSIQIEQIGSGSQ